MLFRYSDPVLLDSGAVQPYHVRTLSVRKVNSMITMSFLMNSDALTQELRRETRSDRMEQRVKPTIKQVIEYAATLSGADMSEFVSTAAYKAAMDKIMSTRFVHLTWDDALRFGKSLEINKGPNQAMSDLMAGYNREIDDDEQNQGAGSI